MRYGPLILMLALLTAGCDQRKAELKKALAEARAAEALRDTLLTEILETTQFVSDLNSELAKAKTITIEGARPDHGVPSARSDREERKRTLQRIQLVIARLNESETKLIATESRARSAKAQNARLLEQIATYKRTIEDLKVAAEQQRAEHEAIISDQKSQISSLNQQLDTLDRSVRNLTAFKNTVYYVAGPKKQLLEKGVVTKEGSKFLIFGGTRLEPARNLNVAAFTPIDKTRTLSIPLPRTDKKYKIISRQSPAYLTGAANEKGEIEGGVVEVRSPEQFWSTSRYLILVEK
jgi:hypothetical protein